MPVRLYMTQVIAKVLPVLLVSFLIPGLAHFFMSQGWVRLLAVCIISLIVIVPTEYYMGLNKNERAFFLDKMKKVINKIK